MVGGGGGAEHKPDITAGNWRKPGRAHQTMMLSTRVTLSLTNTGELTMPANRRRSGVVFVSNCFIYDGESNLHFNDKSIP